MINQLIEIPDFSLVVLVGATGSGKSSFARKHFKPTEIISSDTCRGFVADDETDQSATSDAFELLHLMAELRLKNRRLTVIDSTAARKEDRAKLVSLARKLHAPVIALVLDIDPKICAKRNETRPDRKFGEQVPRNHARMIRKSLRHMRKDGFSNVYVMKGPEQVDAIKISRVPLFTDLRGDTGPFDIVGDVHGCFDELTELLADLGYVVDDYEAGEALLNAVHPDGRKAFFVGDLCDRGPRNVDVLRLVMGMVQSGTGNCVIGNHDFKLLKWLRGQRVTTTHGLDLTVSELEKTSDEFRAKVREFIFGLRSHAWLDGGQLVVAHAGLKEEMHGRGSPGLKQFAMFGETTGEVDEFGLPVRLEWARDYRGQASVIYGHTPMLESSWLNSTMCIDTGCVFGGKLTALRWPEKEVVCVPARKQYAEPRKPLDAGSDGDVGVSGKPLIYFDEFLGKRRIETRFRQTVTIPEGNATAALEAMSRFAIDPRWLIHLPPTMAPCPTTPDGPFLEHPNQALDYYQDQGVSAVVAQEKHMWSRALVLVCRSVEAAKQRFRVEDGKFGVVFTRTGRPFFQDESLEAELVTRLAAAAGRAGLWTKLDTNWFLLDAELMPWSAKAQDLLTKQYGPTAVAAKASADALEGALRRARGRIAGVDTLVPIAESARQNAIRFSDALRGYCWAAADLDAHRLAPFHILASEGAVYADKPHDWHMQTLAGLCAHDDVLLETKWQLLDPGDAADRKRLIDWWLEHTESGGEGLVIKPRDYVPVGAGKKYAPQPAMKVRGRNYLRIIYGPDYDVPQNLERLRERGLRRKWSLAQREFALGLEGLQRFVEQAPLSRVHECALAVLALESEPVDPRL